MHKTIIIMKCCKLKYAIYRRENGFVIMVEKTQRRQTERVRFFLCENKEKCIGLFRRLYTAKVTPMSVAYILEDEGFCFTNIDNLF